jgi:uncharacterized membrane protein YraQ (UPF0718 family)
MGVYKKRPFSKPPRLSGKASPFTSYIIGGELRQEGVSMLAITAFIVVWVTVGIIQLPAEALMLGKRFAIARNAVSFFVSIVIAFLTVLTLGMAGVNSRQGDLQPPCTLAFSGGALTPPSTKGMRRPFGNPAIGSPPTGRGLQGLMKIIEKAGFDRAFFLLSLAAYVLLGIYDFALLKNVLSALAGLIARIAPILLLVFAVMFFTNLFFESSRMVRFLGKGSGLQGWMVTIAGGIASSGPIYMWYPLLSDLKEKGMKDALLAAFLYNRAVKIPLLPMMVYYFGWSFTLLLSIYMVLFSVVNGVLVQVLAREGSEE